METFKTHFSLSLFADRLYNFQGSVSPSMLLQSSFLSCSGPTYMAFFENRAAQDISDG